jgi:hypothetical protein
MGRLFWPFRVREVAGPHDNVPTFGNFRAKIKGGATSYRASSRNPAHRYETPTGHTLFPQLRTAVLEGAGLTSVVASLERTIDWRLMLNLRIGLRPSSPSAFYGCPGFRAGLL